MIEDNPSGLPEQIQDQLATTGFMDVDLLPPSEVSKEVLRCAAVVILDHRLDFWEERDALVSVALRPENGVALASVLRSHLKASDITAFCLLTAHPEDLVGDSPSERRPQVLARNVGLEWVFSKEQSAGIAEQVLSLAGSVARVRKIMQKTFLPPDKLIMAALGLDKTPDFSDLVWRTVERCQPPLVQLEEWDVPMCLIRWLLHRILPYSTFLCDIMYLAVRLRATPESLLECIDGDSLLAQSLESCRYSGILSEFAGRRWWRAAIDDLVWSLGGQGLLSQDQLWKQLEGEASNTLQPLNIEEPVVCVNEKLEPAGIEPLSKTVRLQPEDWPSFALVARTPIETARESTMLKLLLAEADLELLEDESDMGE
jgi:hypothetical protein